LASGHPDAWNYSIGVVTAEAKLVSQRLDVQLAQKIGLQQMMISSVPNMSVKPAASNRLAKELVKTLKAMFNG
jgi:hypothetical protein